MTQQELQKIATDKDYFGPHEILFGAEDGNIFVKEEYAQTHCAEKKIEYFQLTKEAPKVASKNEK